MLTLRNCLLGLIHNVETPCCRGNKLFVLVEWSREDDEEKYAGIVDITDTKEDGRVKADPPSLIDGGDSTDVNWKTKWYLAKLLFSGKS